MKQAKTPTPAPMKIDVKIFMAKKDGPVLANASVNLNDCFAIKGIQIREGKNGAFVSMPSYKSGNEYKDYCFPCTKEFKREFDEAVFKMAVGEIAGPVKTQFGYHLIKVEDKREERKKK